ncbi:GNAT family N-acetyltransferase [Brevibacterium jeotgali]|uniref:ElaA protein n=1 Tax=Brevibacterium jeotgali TaxID=1262550 RepID=A0A2H1L6R5_9MICO|nr:GNAT family N-acetyltransferase [Brevibacterium jeotgali]TWC02694.1 ElaA protein [Brevibacterium jeotgali]SMY12604.1 ElaA protein [Brevibacterium jeotgali]
MSGRPAAPQPIPSVADAGTRTVSPDGWVLTTTSGLTLPELYGILQLRSRVFVVEQESLYLDLDGLDLLPGTLHLMLPAPGEVLRPAKDSHGGASGLSAEPRGYARILPDGYEDGPAARPGARSIGRVVTSPEARGRGLGRLLLQEAVRLFGQKDLTLNAQSHLDGYYGSCGFSVSGPEFLEDGILHVPMHRPGSPAA